MIPSSGRRNSFFVNKLGSATAVVAALALFAVGCDDMLGSKPPGEPPSPAGNYIATVGQTRVNLEVTDDAFTAVTFTEPRASAAARIASVQAAGTASVNGDDDDAVWVVLKGDVTADGNAVTVEIDEVVRDRQPLAGVELQRYTDCEITATAGDAFDDQVMAGIAECLDTTDSAPSSTTSSPPAELIIGDWILRSASYIGVYDEAPVRLSIAATQIEMSFYGIGCGVDGPCSADTTRRFEAIATAEFNDTQITELTVHTYTVRLLDPQLIQSLRDQGLEPFITVSPSGCSLPSSVDDGSCDNVRDQMSVLANNITDLLPIHFVVDSTSLTWNFAFYGESGRDWMRFEKT